MLLVHLSKVYSASQPIFLVAKINNWFKLVESRLTLRLKVNRHINFSCIMFFFILFVLRSLRFFKIKTKDQLHPALNLSCSRRSRTLFLEEKNCDTARRGSTSHHENASIMEIETTLYSVQLHFVKDYFLVSPPSLLPHPLLPPHFALRLHAPFSRVALHVLQPRRLGFFFFPPQMSMWSYGKVGWTDQDLGNRDGNFSI